MGRLTVVQRATSARVELAFVDWGCTYQGETSHRRSGAPHHPRRGQAAGRLPVGNAKRQAPLLMFLPCPWVVERAFAWAIRCRRLVNKDYERLVTTLAGLHIVVFVCLMLRQAAELAPVHSSL